MGSGFGLWRERMSTLNSGPSSRKPGTEQGCGEDQASGAGCGWTELLARAWGGVLRRKRSCALGWAKGVAIKRRRSSLQPSSPSFVCPNHLALPRPMLGPYATWPSPHVLTPTGPSKPPASSFFPSNHPSLHLFPLAQLPFACLLLSFRD